MLCLRPRCVRSYLWTFCASSSRQTRRNLHLRVIAKRKEAEDDFQARAREIRDGERKSMLSILQERGFIDQITGSFKELDDLMTSKRIGAYAGFDPTARSLHVGHLVPLMVLFWLYIHGYHAVSLLGGATAKIGDPTGRESSRPNLSAVELKENVVSIHYQLKVLWENVEELARKYNYHREYIWHREVPNNGTWLNKTSFLEILRLMGPAFRIGTMLSRDTVKNRIERGDGMNLTEFCYPVFQAWDWWYMFDTKGIQMQIGGSDQYGNIVASRDAVKYMQKNHPDSETRQKHADEMRMRPIGLTVPLLTTSTGQKFGKSAGNAVYLHPQMTSTFDLYQYFLRLPDDDIPRFLKLLTFLPIPDIDAIVEQHQQDPSKRIGHHRLASEVLKIVHGEKEASLVEQQHRLLFRRGAGLKLSEINQQLSSEAPSSATDTNLDQNPSSPSPQPSAFDGPSARSQASHILLPRSCVYGRTLAQILYSAGMVPSRSEGHRTVVNKGAYIGQRLHGEAAPPDELTFTAPGDMGPFNTDRYLIEGELLILRIGKWKVRIIRMIEDWDFDKRGLDCPGWKEEEKASERTRLKNAADAEVQRPGKVLRNAEHRQARHEQAASDEREVQRILQEAEERRINEEDAAYERQG